MLRSSPGGCAMSHKQTPREKAHAIARKHARTPEQTEHDWKDLALRISDEHARAKDALRALCKHLGVTEPWAGEPLPDAIRRVREESRGAVVSISEITAEEAQKEAQCSECDEWSPVALMTEEGVSGYWWAAKSNGCPECGVVVCVEAECSFREREVSDG